MSNTDIEASEVARRIAEDDAEDLFVLDVRNEEDYEEWQIPGSTNVPIYDELLQYDYSGLEDNLDDLPEDEEIAVVCVAGVTSSRATDFLREHGFDAKSIPDGMNAWGRVHREYDVDSADGITQIVRPGTGCVSYLAHDGDEAVVVDPIQYIDQYLNVADDNGLDIIGIADTHAHADHVSGARRLAGELDVPYYLDANLPFVEVLKRATYGDKTLFAAAQAGHIEKFVDTLFWLAVPLYLTSQGLGIAAVGFVVAVHSAMYFLQIATGGLADRIGRRPPVLAGMFLAGAGVLGMVLVDGYFPWVVLSGVSGLGMALLYPNLMTVPGDAAHPTWRATGMGVYRMWRDTGYGVGAILIGLSMELLNIEAAFYVIALLMFVSGAIVYIWMQETHPEFGTHEPPAPE
ncbi:MFS transporter [Salinirarus marinus]|uniref:MFS transporter n=1 Tax=Salinirarus marinus TaxID=3068310 RepID=UPI003C6BF2F3